MAQQKLTTKYGSGCGRHGQLLREYQSQKMTAAAMQMADMKVCAHRS